MVGNSISTVPPQMAELRNLQVLKLGVNNFVTFPVGLFALPSLSSLHLNNNKITTFPEIDADMVRAPLATLNLESNQVSALPNCIYFISISFFIFFSF